MQFLHMLLYEGIETIDIRCQGSVIKGKERITTGFVLGTVATVPLWIILSSGISLPPEVFNLVVISQHHQVSMQARSGPEICCIACVLSVALLFTVGVMLENMLNASDPPILHL